MPAELVEPLGVVFSLPDGALYQRRLDDLPDSVHAAASRRHSPSL